MSGKMDTKGAIEFLERAKKTKSASTRYMILDEDCISGIITLLKTKQEMVTKFSSECEEYQKRLDQIDSWAMEIEERIKI